MRKKYDIEYSTEIEMEHPVWAKPYINGSIKAFFVPNIRYGREIVELIHRMDIEYETVTIDRSWDSNKWGFGDFYDLRGGIWNFDIMYKNLENILASDEEFDVLVIPGINGWGHFTPKTREAILKRVEKGAGLVLIHPFTGAKLEKTEALEKLSPLMALHEEGFNEGGYPDINLDILGKDRWVADTHYITGGIPFDIIPFEELGYYPYEASGDVIIRSESGMPIAAVKEYGKGRVVAFGYFPRGILPEFNPPMRGSCFDSDTSGNSRAHHDIQFNFHEYFYNLVGRSMLWAARKEPSMLIDAVQLKDDKISLNLSEADNAVLSYKIKNLYDETVFERQTETTEIKLPELIKIGGDYRVEILLKNGEKICDWYTLPVNYPLAAEINCINLECEMLKSGEMIKGSVDVQGTEACLEIVILDDFDRAIYLKEFKTEGRASYEFGTKVENVRSLNIRVRASLKVNGLTIHKMESKRILVVPDVRTINDLEVILAPVFRGRPEFMHLLGKLFREMGVTGLFPGDNKVLTRSGASGLGVYWYHRAPYVERKENYLKTGDKKYLHRVPCLNDPDFWDKNAKNIRDTVSENKKFGPISYFANDEGSLTCYTDQLELCFCPHCMSEMRDWLKGEYANLEELNDEWGTEFDNWDEVTPYTFQEAKKSGQYASWGDHRRFMELTFANAYKRIRDYIKAEDPQGVVRMSGCQASTPYSGYDYYQLHQYVGYFEAYGVGNQMEYHRSFAKPETIIGGWTGYGVSGVNATHQIWGRMLHGLTLMSIFWQYACINPDLTYSRSAMDMGRAFKEIRREGIGKLLLYSAKRDNLGIAIHYSMPSIHGSFIRGDEPRFVNNRQGWLDLLEDMGYQYDFIATQQIEAGELMEKGFKLLILPYSIAISKGEEEQIRRFVEEGGIVIGDFQTGIMDVHCKLFDEGILDDVFGIVRYTTDAYPFYTDRELILKKDFPYFERQDMQDSSELSFAESGTRASSGKAAYVQDFSGTVPAVVVNETGKGKGIYLNFGLHEYSKQRDETNGGYYTRELMNKVLSFAGIQKFCQLEAKNGKPKNKGYETVYYSDNNAKYIAVIRGFEDKQFVGHDGLAVGGATEADGQSETIILKLPFEAHIYDVRGKKYIGFTSKIETSIGSGDTKIFSLLPHTVDKVEVDLEDKVCGGDMLNVNIRIVTDKVENEYANVVSINFYTPSGEYGWMYSENHETTDNTLTRQYHLPFNEEKGVWRIVVKDVATGVWTEKTFEVV